MSTVNGASNDIRREVERALLAVAPDVDLTDAPPDENLFDAFDIDSMDFLRLVTRLSERFEVDMPERDYPRMQSIDALVGYLASERTS